MSVLAATTCRASCSVPGTGCISSLAFNRSRFLIRTCPPALRALLNIALLALALWPFPDLELRAQAAYPRGVDTTIAPGDDFFGYANGAWLKVAVIPEGADRWTVRDEIRARTNRQVVQMLDEARRAAPGSLARKAADFRAAWLNRAAIEQKGLAPLQPMLARIDSAQDLLALTRLLGSTMHADVDPLNLGVYASSSVLGLSVEHSIHGEKGYTAFLVQGGLGLGDRSRYLDADSGAVERLNRYRDYVTSLFMFARLDHAAERAESVLALERALAEAQATLEASVVDRNADHLWSRADFAREAPGMDWDAYFEAAGLGQQQMIVAWQPSAVRGVAQLVASQSIESWKNYLRFHLIDHYAEVLPRSYAEAAADLRGDNRTPERRALAATELLMADAIGELYARRWFSPAQKARVERIVANVAAAFRSHVARAAWLSPASRETALAKLDRLYVGVGYPDRWEDWSDLVIETDDAIGNVQRIEDRNYHRALDRLDQPYDPHEWVLTPRVPGAVLVFQQNAYTFSAALLQPPKFDSTASDAEAYGAIGAIIAHDISHFVDVLGVNYEPDGRMHQWWTDTDSARFEAAAEPIVRQFSGYEPLPGLRVDGRLTRTENVADLAGLTAAFEAYRASLGARAGDPRVMHREDRAFFIAFAQAFGARLSDAALRAQLATDHAPDQYRMDTVRNLDAWYDAFDVVPGQRLYLEPSARVHIW